MGVTRVEALLIVLGLIVVTSFISTLSGLWGVLVTDLVQFAIKMTMVTVLAVYAVHAVGGMDALKMKLAVLDHTRGAHAGALLNFIPDLNSPWMPMITFFVYISLNWWATWYPGAEPGGGGYIAQRMFSAKDEKNSLLATLWFNIAHFAIRPWPWILVALASLVLFPGLEDPESGYVRVMIAYLPASLRGVMLAAFAAAYMSTIATQLNWGASYVVNDFYRRFIRPQAADQSLRSGLEMDHGSADHRFHRGHVFPHLHRRRLEDAVGHRRRHRTGAAAALVLVADQRVERNFRHDHGVYHVSGAANRRGAGQRQARGFRLDHDHHGERHYGGLAGGDVRYAA